MIFTIHIYQCQSTIFEEFRQTEDGSGRRAPGTGLGLAIVLRMVDLLGGTVSVRSEVGEGSACCVLLPLQCAEPNLPDQDL